MHIPDGVLEPKIIAVLGSVSAGTLAIAAKKVREEVGEEKVPLLGVTAAFIFAAQMLNFPVAAGTSGHLIGGVLAALLLGPWAGFLVISSVLILQALLFQDGGVLALSANIFNMALIGSFGSFYAYCFLNKIIKNFSVAIFLTSWLSVVLASLACATELYFSGLAGLIPLLVSMGSIHALIGVGEGLITSAIIGFLKSTRPDLLLKGVLVNEK